MILHPPLSLLLTTTAAAPPVSASLLRGHRETILRQFLQAVFILAVLDTLGLFPLPNYVRATRTQPPFCVETLACCCAAHKNFLCLQGLE